MIRNGKKQKSEDGFSLIELLATLAVLSVILLIAVPVFTGSIAEAEQEVCEANRAIIEKHYEMELSLEGDNHSTLLFRKFLIVIDKDL
ncbi:type II secretion system protein [Virgibacillus halodenitrificans]|uniref:type II secretion system protein n=1 Tax=Virgibacillus halodenitrificans TaxID=1482 RepID=UPI001F460D06|nr:type II secretion system protein [Virgibacillus halodenitrificans]